MSKADVIEVEAYELYPYSSGRQSNHRAVPIRSGQGTYYLER